MSTLLSIAAGNFTSSSTWGVVDSGSLLDSEAGTTAISTSNLDSSTFTTGIITVSGVALKLSARASSPSGTFTVTLRNSTLGADVASVTVNVSDLPSGGLGWCYFKFSAQQVLSTSTNYIIRCVCSNTGSQVTLYRNATANNHSRLLVTTTTQAPASGDQLIICGDFTGAGTSTSRTVTMDSTATTVYGSTSFTQSITINSLGSLTYGTSSSTTYILKFAGLFDINSGGTFNMGTVATPIPSSSIARLDMSVSSNVDTGIRVRNGGTWIAQGVSKTTYALLNANAAASATSLTTDVSTGWKNGDVIALAATSRTYTEAENRTLSADASTTTLTISSGLTNAHSGTSPTQAEVINLTRNVLIQGTSTSLQGYIVFEATATVDWDYVECTALGSATSLKRGIDVQTTTGSINLNGCSLHDFGVTSSVGISLVAASGSALVCTSMVSYNIDSRHFYIQQTSSGTWSVDGWVAIKSVQTSSQGQIFDLVDCGGTLKNLRISSAGSSCISIQERGSTIVDYSNWNIHSGNSNGVLINGLIGVVTGTNACWRNNGAAFFSSTGNGGYNNEFQNFDCFGNTGGGVDIRGPSGRLTFKGCTFAGDSTFSSLYGFNIVANSSNAGLIIFISCSFGVASGIRTAHTAGDIQCNVNTIVQARFINCTFASSTRVASQNTLGDFPFPYVSIESSSERTLYMGTGTITKDTTIYKTSSPSIRMAPLSASVKLQSAPFDRGFLAPVDSGTTKTISLYIRKSVAGDGAAYNGNEARLILRRQDILGITADTVLATSSGSAGSWLLLSGTTASASLDGVFEFIVDCDGTAGWINVDDISVS